MRFKYIASEGRVEAIIRLPDSYAPGDGVVSEATAVGNDETEATELVCKELMIQRLVLDAECMYPDSALRLVPSNWNVTIHALRRAIRSAVTRPRLHEAGVIGWEERSLDSSQVVHPVNCLKQPAAHEGDARQAELEELLVAISENETSEENVKGWALTGNLKRMWVLRDAAWMQIDPQQWLRRLVEPATLPQFLRDRPRLFECEYGSLGLSFRSLKERDPERDTVLAGPVLSAKFCTPPDVGDVVGRLATPAAAVTPPQLVQRAPSFVTVRVKIQFPDDADTTAPGEGTTATTAQLCSLLAAAHVNSETEPPVLTTPHARQCVDPEPEPAPSTEPSTELLQPSARSVSPACFRSAWACAATPGPSQDQQTPDVRPGPRPTRIRRQVGPAVATAPDGNPIGHCTSEHDEVFRVIQRNIDVETRLKELSAQYGWVVPEELSPDVQWELTQMLRPNSLWGFVSVRPFDFEMMTWGYELRGYRAINRLEQRQLHHQTINRAEDSPPSAPLPTRESRSAAAYSAVMLAGNCTCGECPNHWFEDGWSCRGPARGALSA